MSKDAKDEIAAQRSRSVELLVSRGELRWTIGPAEFDDFPFEDNDDITIIPSELGDHLPMTWGDRHVEIAPGRAIRVPPIYKIAEVRGFRIPVHLIWLSRRSRKRWRASVRRRFSQMFEEFGKIQFNHYQRYTPFDPDMTIVDLGCGMPRLAFPLFNFLKTGRYIGIDVIRDSMAWCQKNITPRYPNFTFHHFDAFNELYNPYGCYRTKDFSIPVDDRTVDRIFLYSVFTHLLEDEVLHYMREFRRILKPDGLAFATFFLYPEKPINLAPHLSFLTFENHYGNGVYGSGEWKRGSVAYTDQAMRRMFENAGLHLVRPYLKGEWSGQHGDAAESGQDVAILRA
jgi:SAM-dependent methyltransferase